MRQKSFLDSLLRRFIPGVHLVDNLTKNFKSFIIDSVMSQRKICEAITKKGTRCTREVQEKQGCKMYCWQHAYSYKKRGQCVDERIKRCKSSDRKYPCKKKGVIYRSDEQYENDFEGEIEKCKKKKPKFPCTVHRVVVNNRREMNEHQRYRESIKEERQGHYLRRDRAKVAERANRELNREKTRLAGKEVARRVKFEFQNNMIV